MKIRTALAALALAGTMLNSVAMAQDAANAATADVVVNMRGVEIADVADQISRITGRTLILDPAVKGVVTVTSATPLSPAGVWELFQSVLRANGFASVRSGRAWRIVPAANAVRDGGVPGRGVAGQALVTRMVRLQNVPAADVARVVRPLVATFGSVEPLTSPNAVVITDYADNVARVEGIARQLDGGSGATFATIALKNGDAAQVAESLRGVLGDGGAKVAADPRSNTIIVRGTPSAVNEARKIALSLDAPGGATPITRMFRLNYADAESVTNVLRGILGQGEAADNPIARSLSSGNGVSALNRTNASAALSGLTSSNGAPASAGGNASTAPEMIASNAAPQGFATPELTVQPAPELNAVVVRGKPQAIQSIEQLITDLDVRRPQVLIEAAIAEITGDDAEALAIQLGTSGLALNQVEGAATSFSQVGPSLGGTGGILALLGVPAGALLGDGLSANVAIGNDFSILVQALGVSSKANLLSTPQITTLDNVVGEIVVGQNVPFVTGSILTGNGTANPYTTIERKDVGITLRILPRVNAGDTIRLQVNQEASSIATANVTGASDLITNRRAINTTVLADNGETIVLGGLISDDYMDVRRQVPILGDIPIVGELFKSRRESRQKRTLFIFLKPTILRDGKDASAAAKDKYARLRSEEIANNKRKSLLLAPPTPRLTVEIDGIY
ncbi:MAG: type II secretion system secretin GspD [Pseudomonadota bacterium]